MVNWKECEGKRDGINNHGIFFFILFTVHPGMIRLNNQMDAQLLMYVYFYSLHVSGSHVPIIRRIIVSMRHLVYVTLCRWPPGKHTRRVFKRTISRCFVSQRRIKVGDFRVQIGSVSARFSLLAASILRESAVNVVAPDDVLSQNTVLLKLTAETI